MKEYKISTHKKIHRHLRRYQGSILSGFYSLPKTHNDNIPLCPIFSMLHFKLAKLLAVLWQFSSNSTLDISGVSLPNFPFTTESLLIDMHRTTSLVSAIISNLVFISLIVIKKLATELAPVLCKLYNKCLLFHCLLDVIICSFRF